MDYVHTNVMYSWALRECQLNVFGQIIGHI